MQFEISYRDERRDRCELTFDILCRMSEKFDATVSELTASPRLDWLVWGAHQALLDDGKTTLPLDQWRKSIKEFVPLGDGEDLNPTEPAA